MNKENLTIHLKVKDFNAWRASYNGNEKNRVSAGITNGRVFRSPDNPNEVVILAAAAESVGCGYDSREGHWETMPVSLIGL